MQTTYSKIKITAKDKVEVTYKRTEDDGATFTATEEHSGKPHKDFKAAMQSLAVHLALASEFLPAKTVKNIDTERTTSKEVEKFTVRGFTLGGGDDSDQWVILSGYRKQSTGKAFNFNTTAIDFEAEGDNNYKFEADILDCIGNVKIECTAYLGGKYEEEPQGKLAFEEETK